MSKTIILKCNERSSDAIIEFTPPDSYVVKAGSETAEFFTSSCSDYIKNNHEKNKDKLNGVFLIEDISFKTPSGASSFIMKGNSNGNKDLTNLKGERLSSFKGNIINPKEKVIVPENSELKEELKEIKNTMNYLVEEINWLTGNRHKRG